MAGKKRSEDGNGRGHGNGGRPSAPATGGEASRSPEEGRVRGAQADTRRRAEREREITGGPRERHPREPPSEGAPGTPRTRQPPRSVSGVVERSAPPAAREAAGLTPTPPRREEAAPASATALGLRETVGPAGKGALVPGRAVSEVGRSERPDRRFGDPRARVIIEQVTPQVDRGLHAAKHVVGDTVRVEADVFADGHDRLTARIRYRKEGSDHWTEMPMEPLANDRWRGRFSVLEMGRYWFTVTAWIDRFDTWTHDLRKKAQAGQDLGVELMAGARLITEAAERATGEARDLLEAWALEIEGDAPQDQRLAAADSDDLARMMARWAPRHHAVTHERELPVWVDRERAGFSSWYELFPRSTASEPGRHGTFADVEQRLAYVAGLGFDVLYLPPIHPVGHTFRKGPNNTDRAGEEDPGSPWAIGSEAGGHKAVHPDLGTLDDFRHLVTAAGEHGLEIALDIAFQCSPDHPYVREHPEWFKARPDGTIQYAENPPKKYQDIYPFDFESEAWESLWDELKSVFLFWIEQGVRIFRVDNPHTKPFRFWAWVIDEVRREHPDVLFLAEAFTRPKVMYQLAKLGFTQSYTYFAWKNTAWELERYLQEIARAPVRDFFRPNLWPNTPDILNEYLQFGGRAGFKARAALAATLSSSWGIYGPAFETGNGEPREPGSEEYRDSEKYQVRHWDWEPDGLYGWVARLNRIRRDNPAVREDRSLTFHPVDNEQLICYSKRTEDRSNVILAVVNLDPHHTQSGWVDLDLDELGLERGPSFQVHDLVSGARFLWYGGRNYLELDPRAAPAHVFRIRRRIRTERDFEYFM